MPVVYLGIGTNIGVRQENYERAVSLIQAVPGIKLIERSAVYITRPESDIPQEDYLNGVLKIETDISPEELLALFKGIERKMGRKPSEVNAPRVIDIDILFYGKQIIKSAKLTIPHPGLGKRYFVLRGMNDIAPDVMHPETGKTMHELYAGLKERE
ncbi:MAG: 2-amino-4-hydroxy-6-hydroxymethyldihydropteridine diphosphokinase [Candidatus Omnitrophota bacterium]